MPNRVLRESSLRLPLLTTALVLLPVVLGASGQFAYSAAPFYEGKANSNYCWDRAGRRVR